MFESYLKSIENINPNYYKFANDLSDHIKYSLERKMPLYATHSFCTDGGVVGAMIKYSVPEASIVPLDYWILNDEKISGTIGNLDWVGIVDLIPFNIKPVDFWVDHHISAMGKKINAKRIRFDEDGDSGAYQLLLSKFLGPYPEKIVELAVMTRTTDTANYITEPPVNQISKLTDLDLTETTGDEGKKQSEQRIWLLDDAWGSVETLKDHLNLYRWLAKDGFYGIRHVLDSINRRRDKRKKAYDIADSIEIDHDIIIIAFEEEKQDKFTILRRLQKNGAKVAVSFSISKNSPIKVSLRRNRELSDKENELIQLHKIASKMNGGGHQGAAGGEVDTVSTGLDIIKQWGQDHGLSTKLIEL